MFDIMTALLTALLSFTAVVFLIDQNQMKPRPYKTVWAIGLGVYGIAAFAQFCGSLGHWTPLEYRLWYLTGAILAAPYLGMGTVYLLAPRRVADILMIVTGVFTAYAIPRVLTTPLVPRTHWLPAGESVSQWLASAPDQLIVNAGTHSLMPGDIVFVIIIMNSLGALALVGGAGWSAWKFWRTKQGGNRLISMIALAIGGLAPTSAGTLTRLGFSNAFYLLTLIGALFLLIGYLISIDVFTVFRIPFTDIVLRSRRTDTSPILVTAGSAGLAFSAHPRSIKRLALRSRQVTHHER